MAVKERSFWSTTAGVVTGVTGLLTAVGGVLGIGMQAGWIGGGGDSDGGGGSTSTTVASTTNSTVNPLLAGGSASSGSSGSGGSSGAAAPQFTVTPTQVRFDRLGPREATVTVRNTGTGAFAMQTPKVEGTNASMFTIADNTCASRLDAGRSCELKVAFAPRGGGDFSAKLVVQPTGAPAQEVPLSGSALL